MNINEFDYIWTTNKEDYVLLKTELDYVIFDVKNHSMLLIEDEEISNNVVEKMIIENIPIVSELP